MASRIYHGGMQGQIKLLNKMKGCSRIDSSLPAGTIWVDKFFQQWEVEDASIFFCKINHLRQWEQVVEKMVLNLLLGVLLPMGCRIAVEMRLQQ